MSVPEEGALVARLFTSECKDVLDAVALSGSAYEIFDLSVIGRQTFRKVFGRGVCSPAKESPKRDGLRPEFWIAGIIRQGLAPFRGC